MLAAVESDRRPTFQPAGAGVLLAAGTAAGVGGGTLVGWAFGAPAVGALVGAIVGIPAGVFVVYRRYRGFFT